MEMSLDSVLVESVESNSCSVIRYAASTVAVTIAHANKFALRQIKGLRSDFRGAPPEVAYLGTPTYPWRFSWPRNGGRAVRLTGMR